VFSNRAEASVRMMPSIIRRTKQEERERKRNVERGRQNVDVAQENLCSYKKNSCKIDGRKSTPGVHNYEQARQAKRKGNVKSKWI
jgi:hypothetical protein